MDTIQKLSVFFYRTEAGREPVREWLKDMSKEDRKIIGEDVKLVQFRWPLGMPLVRKMENGLWEVRTHLKNRSISRVFFTVYETQMILLHSIIKKSTKTPQNEIETARNRKNIWLNQVKL